MANRKRYPAGDNQQRSPDGRRPGMATRIVDVGDIGYLRLSRQRRYRERLRLQATPLALLH